MDQNTQLINTITTFLKDIGLETVMQPIEGAGFVPGISLNNGRLIIDTSQLKYTGDIIYAAGRLAVMPPEERVAMDDIIPKTDMQQSGGIMAIAWAYAACIHLGLDPHVVFHDGGYDGQSEALISHFRDTPQWGIPMLQWCGMTYDARNAAQLNKLPFPHMQSWVREK
ncbi:MAG: hypothetical protein V4577_25840 [Bacteroidota bacterium]